MPRKKKSEIPATPMTPVAKATELGMINAILDKHVDSRNHAVVSVVKNNTSLHLVASMKTGEDPPIYVIVFNSTRVSKSRLDEVAVDLIAEGMSVYIISAMAMPETTAAKLGL